MKNLTTSKNKILFLIKAAILGLISMSCGIMWTYMLYSAWGLNAQYVPTFFGSFFESFCPSQNVGLLEMPSRYEVLQETAHRREDALWTLDVCLRGWALDSHREMTDFEYFLAIARRVKMCLAFATLSTFSQWLQILFEHLQPLSPIWSTWYDVNAGHLYGIDEVTYRDYIRQGAKIFSKLLFNTAPLNPEELDKLPEILLYIAVTLSNSAENPDLKKLLENVEDPWLL